VVQRIQYGVRPQDNLIDYDQIEALAPSTSPS
jgi:glycine/serine hydroxymethyltransferase